MPTKLILRCAVAFAILIPCYVLAMALVIKLPVDARIAAHLRGSVEHQVLFADDGNREYSAFEQNTHRFDMFSDCLELGMDLENTDQSTLRRALLVPYIANDTSIPAASAASVPCKDLVDAVTSSPRGYTPYFRFWHGSLIYMRLLLTISDLGFLRLFNAVVLYGSVLAFSFKLRDWFGACAVAVFVLPYALCSDLVTASLVTTHALPLACTYLTAAIFMSMLEKHRRVTDSTYLFVFISGSFYNFFNMLFTPELVPLFLAFMAIAAAYRWQPARSSIEKLKTAFAVIVTWFAGYALTWIAKWVLCIMVAGKAFIMHSVSSAASGTNYISHQSPMAKHLFGPTWYIVSAGPVGRACVTLIVVGWIVAFAIFARTEDRSLARQQRQNFLLLQAPGLLVIVWFEVMRYHSLEHSFFARRASLFLVIAPVLALLLILRRGKTTPRQLA